jgi:MYXO-CTERM domain-containing protein
MRRLILMSLLLCAPAQANVPAAFNACEGAQEMDPCSTPGPNHGACVLDTLCTDNPDTEVNECLLCQDPCWATEAQGGPCIQITSTPGICAMQDRCTDRVETSFVECNRCVPGEVPKTEPKDDGCALGGAPAHTPWPLLALLLVPLLRRRRAS